MVVFPNQRGGCNHSDVKACLKCPKALKQSAPWLLPLRIFFLISCPCPPHKSSLLRCSPLHTIQDGTCGGNVAGSRLAHKGKPQKSVNFGELCGANVFHASLVLQKRSCNQSGFILDVFNGPALELIKKTLSH